MFILPGVPTVWICSMCFRSFYFVNKYVVANFLEQWVLLNFFSASAGEESIWNSYIKYFKKRKTIKYGIKKPLGWTLIIKSLKS